MKLSELRTGRGGIEENFITEKWLVRMSAAVEETRPLFAWITSRRFREDSIFPRSSSSLTPPIGRVARQVFPSRLSCINLWTTFYSPSSSSSLSSLFTVFRARFSSPETASAPHKHFQHFHFEWVFSKKSTFNISSSICNQSKEIGNFISGPWWWLKTTAENLNSMEGLSTASKASESKTIKRFKFEWGLAGLLA